MRDVVMCEFAQVHQGGSSFNLIRWECIWCGYVETRPSPQGPPIMECSQPNRQEGTMSLTTHTPSNCHPKTNRRGSYKSSKLRDKVA